MKAKRIQWLDFAKGFTILIVVMIHCLSYKQSPFLYYLLPIFAMPLFFAISGYLFKPIQNLKEYKILLYKKSTSFIIPYIVFALILSLGNVKFLHQESLIKTFIDEFNPVYPVGYLWFLYSLFIIFIFVGSIDLFHINLYIQLLLAVVLLIIQIYIPNITPIKGAFGYLIAFYIGYGLKNLNIKKILKNNYLDVFLYILWITLILLGFYIFGFSNKLSTDMFNYKDVLAKILSIPVFFSAFSKFHHNKIFKYFDKYGKDTLVIYLIHLPIRTVIDHFISINKSSLLSFIVLVALTWIISLLLCYFVKHVKFINFLFYPRKYINRVIVGGK